MIPWLEFFESGLLLVFSQNMSIGRNRWQQIITIAKRDGEYIVAGFTYGAYDTLDLDYSLDCDYNVLTGIYIHNGVEKTVRARRILVANWIFETDILDALDCLY